jgi:hypothetical protein
LPSRLEKRHINNLDFVYSSRDVVHSVGRCADKDFVSSGPAKYSHDCIDCFVAAYPTKQVGGSQCFVRLCLSIPQVADKLLQSQLVRIGIAIEPRDVRLWRGQNQRRRKTRAMGIFICVEENARVVVAALLADGSRKEKYSLAQRYGFNVRTLGRAQVCRLNALSAGSPFTSLVEGGVIVLEWTRRADQQTKFFYLTVTNLIDRCESSSAEPCSPYPAERTRQSPASHKPQFPSCSAHASARHLQNFISS